MDDPIAIWHIKIMQRIFKGVKIHQAIIHLPHVLGEYNHFSNGTYQWWNDRDPLIPNGPQGREITQSRCHLLSVGLWQNYWSPRALHLPQCPPHLPQQKNWEIIQTCWDSLHCWQREQALEREVSERWIINCENAFQAKLQYKTIF